MKRLVKVTIISTLIIIFGITFSYAGVDALKKVKSSATPKNMQVTVNPNDPTWMLRAAEDGNLEEIKRFIDGGVKVNAATKKGTTALKIAAHRGYTEIVEYLLKKGAEVNVEDHTGFSPLMAASYSGDLKSVDLIIEKGAKLDTINLDGLSALMFATLQNHSKVVKHLVEKGASVNIKEEKYKFTALDWAKQVKNQEIIDTLVKAGAKIGEKIEDKKK